MEQLTLNIINKSKTKVIASYAYNFKIELIETLGKDDLPDILAISKELSDIYGNHVLIDLKNINKYFNDKNIGFIIGVPLEYFKTENWSKYDINLGKKNTIYTYAFIINKKYRKSGGYAKTLKKIYINWAKKRNYKFVSGHVAQGISKNFGDNTEIIKVFSNWYGTKISFEYYRRSLL